MSGALLKDDEKETLIHMYVNGMSILKIYQETGRAYATLHKLFDEANVLRRNNKGGGRPRRDAEVLDALHAEARHSLSWRLIPERIAAGESIAAVAQSLNVGEDYVELCLSRSINPSDSG